MSAEDQAHNDGERKAGLPRAAAADAAAASAVITTKMCGQMYGFHPEEVEVRFAECDVPSPYVGNDVLFHMLSDIGAAQQLHSTNTRVRSRTRLPPPK